MRSSEKMNCASCKYAFLNMFVVPCCNCNEGSEFKPKTNADRIRSMTDEELTIFLAETSRCSDWCNLYEKCIAKTDRAYSVCLETWLEWLKQESEDDQ